MEGNLSKWKCKQDIEIIDFDTKKVFKKDAVYEGDSSGFTIRNEGKNVSILQFAQGTPHSVSVVRDKFFEKLGNAYDFEEGDIVKIESGKNAIVVSITDPFVEVSLLSEKDESVHEVEKFRVLPEKLQLSYRPQSFNRNRLAFEPRIHRLRRGEIMPNMVVELRSGILLIASKVRGDLIVLENRLLTNERIYLKEYKNDFEHRSWNREDLDIMNVFGYNSNEQDSFEISKEGRDLLWTRGQIRVPEFYKRVI